MRRALIVLLAISLLMAAHSAVAQENQSRWTGPLNGELMVFRSGEPGYIGEQSFQIAFTGPQITLTLSNGDALQKIERNGAGIGSQAIAGENGSQCLLLAYEDEAGKQMLLIAGTQSFIDFLVEQAGLQTKPIEHENAGAANFALVQLLARDWE
ncbi:MAG: hypothetical protein P9M14_00330, partial [Candidatus Alcyoniella australis]|nr:hypothetical protein [Candidatus Alcyoniella australis]